MKKAKWKIYAFWIVLTELVGALAGLLTRSGTKLYNEEAIKPLLSPPAAVFPIVWGILFLLMGIGTARVYMAPPFRQRTRSLLLFGAQLIFNFFWSIFFFNFRAYGFAFFWLVILWGLILLMILSFRLVDKAAAWLQVPYLLWVTFAAYLNLSTWVLNR